MLEDVEQVSPVTELGDRLVIDVRQSYEVESMPLSKADTRNLPLEELRKRWKEIPVDRPLVAVCAKGIRSAESVRILKEKGFHDVAYVGGGFLMKPAK